MACNPTESSWVSAHWFHEQTQNEWTNVEQEHSNNYKEWVSRRFIVRMYGMIISICRCSGHIGLKNKKRKINCKRKKNERRNHKNRRFYHVRPSSMQEYMYKLRNCNQNNIISTSTADNGGGERRKRNVYISKEIYYTHTHTEPERKPKTKAAFVAQR